MGKRRTRKTSRRQKDKRGEIGTSQDGDKRDDGFGDSAQRGEQMTGQRSRACREVLYRGHVPKFLKDLEHLRGYKCTGDKRPDETTNDDTDRFDDDDEKEAWLRATDEDPSLLKEINPIIANKIKAARVKEKGNEAYKDGNHETAIGFFTTCIELDPENEIYYSNRSAAYAALMDFEKSLHDAEKVVALKPDWVKGWARLAAAQYGLGLYPHAKTSYEKALEIEPDRLLLIDGHKQAVEAERRQIEANKHTFNKGRKRTRTRNSPPKQPLEKKWVRISYEDKIDKAQS